MRGNTIQTHFQRLSYGLLLLLCSTAHAQQASQLSLTVTGQEEQISQDENGVEVVRYSDLASVLPGDVVRYTISYHNHGSDPADSVVITNPIPEQMHYLATSAKSTASTTITFSVDGGKNYAAPEQLTVQENNQTRPAIASDYTHIQWLLNTSIAADEQGSVSYRAKLK